MTATSRESGTTGDARRRGGGVRRRRGDGRGGARPRAKERSVAPPYREPRAVKEFERKQLLERVNREGATIGVDIPDRIDVQGEAVELRDFVFEIKRRDTVPEGEKERVERAKKNLRRERLQRLQRIEENEVSYEEGQRLVESIVGIDRALNALEQLRPANLEREAQLQEAQDQKRWMNFLKQALGRDGGASKRGGR
jgi:hypothetical protein